MVAHLSAHVVLWTVGALACLTVIMYNPLIAHLWPILTGAKGHASQNVLILVTRGEKTPVVQHLRQ